MKRSLIYWVLAIISICCAYLLGNHRAQKEEEALWSRALTIVQGGHFVNHWREISSIESLVEQNDIDGAMNKISKTKEIIEIQLNECFLLPTCEQEFKGEYPEKWLKEIHTNKVKNENAASGSDASSTRSF